jgi:hypothetical protein
MGDFWKELRDKLTALWGGWGSFVTLGSFLLYLFGYLSTRFYLTVMGVGTDLAVLDERYVFAGAKFLVYLVSTVPILLMFVLLPAGLIAGLVRAVKYQLSKRKQASAGNVSTGQLRQWFSNPSLINVIGIIVSVALIQLVMRKCFLFSNLLLAKSLPESGLGLEQLLLDEDDLRRSMFFVGLVTGTIVTGSLWLYARSLASQTSVSKFLATLLAFLVIVQFLFLPINYGIFIQDRYLPRVTDLGDQVPLAPGERAWLVWEGTHTFTYLVQEGAPALTPPTVPAPPSPVSTATPATVASPSIKKDQKPAATASTSPVPVAVPTATASPTETSTPTAVIRVEPTAPLGRRLVSVQQKDLKRTVILQYDQIMKTIFAP